MDELAGDVAHGIGERRYRVQAFGHAFDAGIGKFQAIQHGAGKALLPAHFQVFGILDLETGAFGTETFRDFNQRGVFHRTGQGSEFVGGSTGLSPDSM